MAEALVSVVLEQLASITRKQIEEKVRLVVNVDREVENLIFHFNAIQAVLQDAEERQVKEANVRNWLRNLEDVSYDINDLLDEWDTELLKHQIEKEEKEGVALTKRKKVCLFILSPGVCCGCGPIDKVVKRHDIAKKIKEINEKLTDIANLRQNYNFQNTIRGTEKLERVTSSFVNVSSIIGREWEKNRLMSKLLSENSKQGESPFVVIPIVGMGGLGKTAFAQLVYNDENIKTHFDTRIWVCVSDPFEEIKIAIAIVQVLNKGDNRINSTTLQPLLECIHEYISGKKFFLVLDDVWNPTSGNWEPLMGALQNSATGSRILVTTRKETVAAVMGATADHVIHLNILSDADCLQLFTKIAFFDRERDDQLEDIGRKIVKKCNGLPLAAKTLASLMRYKKTRQEWLDVLDSKIWDFKEVEQQVFQPLFLSYYELSPAVRRCLLYCATFPKDYAFYKLNLIHLWMSNNYLSMEGDKEKEALIGESYFDNLVMRSFFQDFVKNKEDDIIGCKMHDIVHDFVQFLTKHECFVMEVGCGNERNKVLDDKVRHLSLTSISDGSSFPVSIYSCNRLRTLLASGFRFSALSSDLVLQLKCLRTLDLSGNLITDVSKEIGALIHLRYLNLSYNRKLEELPDTVGNLCNLQTLLLEGCSALKTLPWTIRKLINLKHLNLSGCFSLKVPKEIGRLTILERLYGLTIYDDVDENKGLVKLGDLGNLDKLRQIVINNLKSVSEVKKAQFVNKKNLDTLLLNFAESEEGEREEGGELERGMDEKILNAIQPHTNLERLIIGNYHGPTLCLNWMMSLHSLKTLIVGDLPFCELFGPLGKLPSLEYFNIDGLTSLKKLGVDFLGIDDRLETPTILFPKLKTLWFESMEKWEDWEGVEGRREEEVSEIKLMPSLSSFKIDSCPNLKALPDFLWKTPLQKLVISDCENILQGCETASGREWDKVSHIPNIKIDRKYVQKDGVRMEPATTENS